MTDLFEKYGYAIDKLRINKWKKEIELSIKFRVHKKDPSYYSFHNRAERYLPCCQVYKKEDVLRYTHKDFSPTDEERSLYVEAIAPGANDAITSLLNGKSNFEVGVVLLWSKDLGKEQSLLQHNHDKNFHLEDGVFSYNEFVENNGAVRELLKTLRDLKRYKHKPVKRHHTTDLWCTIQALDLFWS